MKSNGENLIKYLISIILFRNGGFEMLKLKNARYVGIITLAALIATTFYTSNKPFERDTVEQFKSSCGFINNMFKGDNGKNPNITSGKINKNNSKASLTSFIIDGETKFSENDYIKVSSKDNKYLEVTSDNTLPYSRFSIKIPNELLLKDTLNLVWQGYGNRMINLLAWDYKENIWKELPTDISTADTDLTLITKLPKSMVNENNAEILVAPATQNKVLKGKIPSCSEYDFSFAWMTDTQYYSQSYPNIYERMVRYIVDKRLEKKFIYGIHTGDIVDNMLELNQWVTASYCMKILDKAKFPYGILAGNHDVGHVLDDYSTYYKYFGEKRYNKNTVYGGSIDNNRNHYDLLSAGGNDYIILYLGWDVTPEGFKWANDTLSKYSNRKAILCTHGYIEKSGKYVDQGKEIYEKVAVPNKNVFMVLCGHYDGAKVNIKRSNGHMFYEVLTDYQFNIEGGAGYFRLLQFNSKNNLLYVNSYSPYKNDYNYYSENIDQYILPLYEEDGSINICTDYINIS